MLPVLMVFGAISLASTGYALYCDAQAADQRRQQAQVRADAERRRQAHEQACRDAQAKAEKLERRKRLVQLGEARAKLAQATVLVDSLVAEMCREELSDDRFEQLTTLVARASAARIRWSKRVDELWAQVAG